VKILHEDSSQITLNLVTILVYGIWFIQIFLDPIDVLSFLPISIFEPVGFLRVIPVSVRPLLINSFFLTGLKFATLISLAFVILNILRNPASILACILITIYQGIVCGFAGRIHHYDLVLLYSAYFLALFPITDEIVKRYKQQVIEVKKNLYGIPLVATLSAICFTYTFVGIYRIVHGDIEVFASDTITYWAIRNSYLELNPTWGFGRFLLEYPLFEKILKLGFVIITIFEVLAPICLFWRWFRYTFLSIMIPFHFLSWIFLNIMFWENLLLFVLFFDIEGIVNRVKSRGSHYSIN